MSGGTRYSVLVVDDDIAVLDTMTALLEDEFEVRGTGSPKHALTMLREHRFDVVIADWQMPEMDGVSFLTSVRAAQRSIACLLVTAHVDALSLEVPWGDRRTIALLKKPVDPDKLFDRVRHLALLASLKRSTASMRTAATRLPTDDN